MDFDYAHNDTSRPEKASFTAGYNRPSLPGKVLGIIKDAREREIPVSDDETLCFLMTCLSLSRAENILEIGTAVGVSAIAALTCRPSAHVTTIEKNAAFHGEAAGNFVSCGVSGRVTQILGDAGEVLPALEGGYDFVFLDGPKAQYVKYLPEIKRLLVSGGALFADDVLLYGYVDGERAVPPKRRMLTEHIKEYISAVTGDGDFVTSVINTGDGVALSVKR